MSEDDHAGARSGWFFYVTDLSVVHGDVAGSAGFAVVGGDLRGFSQVLIRGLVPVQQQDHVRAGDVLGVEPQVSAGSPFQGQPVVFFIVPAGQNSLAGGELIGIGGRLCLLSLLVRSLLAVPDQSGVHQFRPDQIQLFDRAGPLCKRQDRFQIADLFSGLFHLEGLLVDRGLCFAVLLVIILGIAGGTEAGIQRDRDLAAVIIADDLHLIRSRLDQMKIGCQQFSVQTMLVRLLSLLKVITQPLQFQLL